MITCFRCKHTLPPEAFSPDKRRKNGRAATCKACFRAVYATRPEPSPEARAQSAALARQRFLERDKAAYAAAARLRYHSNPEVRAAQIKYSKQWAAEHPDEFNKIQRSYLQRRKAKANTEPCPQ